MPDSSDFAANSRWGTQEHPRFVHERYPRNGHILPDRYRRQYLGRTSRLDRGEIEGDAWMEEEALHGTHGRHTHRLHDECRNCARLYITISQMSTRIAELESQIRLLTNNLGRYGSR
jgi:hypothetical protein